MEKITSKGIVLMNLGSPDSTRVKDVRRYLNQFLMDERVIDMPYLSRLLLVKGIIVPFRAPKSAEAYRTIWTKEGSPLIELTRQLAEAVELETGIPVEMAMRYGNPSIKVAYENLLKKNDQLEEIIAVPLYPHYAMSSYETAIENAKEVYRKEGYTFKLKFIKPYYNEPQYIHALAERIRPYLQQDYDHILFSYHGIPERHLLKSDPTGKHCLKNDDCCSVNSVAHETCYRHQCFITTSLVTSALGIPPGKYSNSFQSRLGRDPWLKPYTDFRLKEMPAERKKKLLILCPAFVSDCLETLEEIEERGKETFMEAGGESYTMIPCLNVHPSWVKTLGGWIKEYEKGSSRMILQD
jgi:ferrochelatase